MLNIFNSNRAGVLLLLPMLIAGFVLINLQFNYYVVEETVNLGLWGQVPFSDAWTPKIAAGVAVLFNALAINWIYNANEFLERNSYLSSLLYVVLLSFFHSFYHLDGMLLAHTCILLTIYNLYELRQNEDGRSTVFNATFFAGLGATFHPPLVAIIPFLLFMIWTIRPFIFRETLLAILGFITPLIYGITFTWYSGHKIDLQILEQATNFENKQVDFLILASLFILIFLLSTVAIRRRMQKASIRLKKLTTILWWIVVVAILFGIGDMYFFGQMERFSLLILPLSVFYTFSFTQKSFEGAGKVMFYLTVSYSLIKFFI